MTAHAAKEFDRRLDVLFKERTHWLRYQIRKPIPGKPPKFDRKKVQKAIIELQDLATECLLHEHAVDKLPELYDFKRQWQNTKTKGWGWEKKRDQFKKWYDEKVGLDNCVYVFWDQDKCLYVGRTMNGKSRPQAHFEKAWFKSATRIDIYASHGAQSIPKLECLTTHRFRPAHLKKAPTKKLYHSKCPICQAKESVRGEVSDIFRLR